MPDESPVDPWILALSKSLNLGTSTDLDNVTSSRGLAAGHSLCATLVSPTTPTSGPEAAPVSPSAKPAVEKETMMPRNGEPVRVSLDTPSHALELKCWTSDAIKERDGRYDWKLEVLVVEGGLQRRGDSFEFTAPSDGYGQTDLIQMPRTLKRPDWQDDFEQSYWVRFSDGLFGNIKVRMIAGGSHYSIVSGYINPKPGSRNLAASPPKRK